MSADHWYLAEIRTALGTPDSADAELLADTAVAYAEACYAVNMRSQRIGTLLSKGLRTEAIQLAEQQPPLLEEVAILDIEQLDAWKQLLHSQGLQQPPQLELEEVAAINTAYAELQDLASLLGKHRVLAAARAPLAARLQLLRQLRTRDPLNPAWHDDVEIYERQRFIEIDRELKAAIKSRDLDAVQSLAEEVGQSEWSLDFPSGLRASISDALNRFTSRDARTTLEDLIEQLEAAYSELDEAETARHAATWREQAGLAGLDSNDPLAQRAAPALEWIEEQAELRAEEQRFQNALVKLENLVDTDAKAASLERAYQAALRFETPLPAVLEQRVRTRLETLEQMRRRRLLLGIGSAVILILLTVGSGSYYVWQESQRAQRRAHAATLEELLQQQKLTEAQRFLSTLPESTTAAPMLAPLVASLDRAVAAESERSEEFEAQMAIAKQAEPGQAPNGILQDLKRLAKTDEESRRVAVLEKEQAAWQARVRESREEKMAIVLRDWAKRLSDMDNSLRQGQTLPVRKESSLLSEIAADLKDFPGVSDSFRSRGEALEAKARALLAYSRKRRSVDASLRKAFASASSPESYVRKLRDFAQNHPDEPEAKVFEEIANDPAWRAALSWSQFWDRNGRDLGDLTPDQAKRLLQEGRQLLPKDQDPTNPLGFDFRKREPRLELIAAQSEAINKLRGWLKEQNFNLWAIRKRNGVVVYSIRKPVESAQNAVSYEILNEDLERERQSTIDPAWVGPAPHTVLSRRISTTLGQAEGEDWLKYFATHSLAVIRDLQRSSSPGGTPEIDPVAGLDLLRRLLVVGGEGSSAFAEAAAPMVERINARRVDFSSPWFLGENARADAARIEARAVTPDATEFIDSLREARYASQKQSKAPPALQWVGIVDATSEVPTVFLRPTAKPGKGVLVVLDSGSKELREVGRIDQGTISELALSRLSTGQPVFLQVSDTAN